jgi:hypothetical protein
MAASETSLMASRQARKIARLASLRLPSATLNTQNRWSFACAMVVSESV